MCGIAGFWTVLPHHNRDWLNKRALTMANTLLHRGPDDKGTWIDEEVGVAFGHRRLSIIDTSDAGHQPMVSSDGRFVLTYNGEVYNFPVLRQELEKKSHRFRGHSDTEVMLASFQEWGVEGSLKKFNGMFAFALWDRRDRLLTLARDRLGEKPLYYGVQKGTLFFASELKAIRAHSHFEPRIDRDALASFLRFSYVPAPYSIYRDIRKLLPGHYIQIKSPNERTESEPYWSLESVVQNNQKSLFSMSEEEAADELERRLKETVKSRMVSDVPLGAFLSGGIDSSTIVALMQSEGGRPVNTFTIGFKEEEFNEAVHAKKVAEHLNTNHTELYVSPKEAMDVIPKLPEMYDEPFADSSQIPTHLISTLTREHVTVALTGDGGDELFAGYNRYILARKYWKLLKSLPFGLRKCLTGVMGLIGGKRFENIYRRFEFTLPIKSRISLPAEKYNKAEKIMSMAGIDEVYKRLVSINYIPKRYLVSGVESLSQLDDSTLWNHGKDYIGNMQKLDLLTYLPDDLLVKVDRAAMAVSLETRVPFLDHELVEFVMGLPLDLKLKNGQGKHLLRKVLYKHVPRKVMERPKMGFTVPLDEWLRGSLKEWAEKLIDPKKLREEGYFKSDPVMKLWNEHLDGRANWGHQLWSIFMFQSWSRKESKLYS